MKTTRLGRTGLSVTRTGFGALPVQRLSLEDGARLLRRAYERGSTSSTPRADTPTARRRSAAPSPTCAPSSSSPRRAARGRQGGGPPAPGDQPAPDEDRLRGHPATAQPARTAGPGRSEFALRRAGRGAEAGQGPLHRHQQPQPRRRAAGRGVRAVRHDPVSAQRHLVRRGDCASWRNARRATSASSP